MTVYTGLPASWTVSQGTWLDAAAAAGDHNDINDTSDATYIRKTTSSFYDSAYAGTTSGYAGFTAAIAGGTEVLRRARARVRLKGVSGTSWYYAGVRYAGESTNQNILGTTATTSYAWVDFPWITSTPGGVDLATGGLTATNFGVWVDDANAAAVAVYFADMKVELETFSVPTTVVTGPASPVTDTLAPPSTFTWVDADGTAQSAAEVKIFTAAQYGAGGFSASTSTAEHTSATLGAVTAYTPTASLTNNTTYKTYTRVGKFVDGVTRWSAWTASTAWSLTVAEPAPPTLTGSWNTATQAVDLIATGKANMLTANQANAETDTTGMVTAGTNCTLSRSTTTAALGSACFRLSSTAAGSMESGTSTAGIPVTAGQAYGASAVVSSSASTARYSTISIRFYDSAGTLMLTAGVFGDPVWTNVTAGAWRVLQVAAVAPTGASYAAVWFGIADTAGAAELHYFDKLAFFPIAASTLGYNNMIGNAELPLLVTGWRSGAADLCTAARSTALTTFAGAATYALTATGVGVGGSYQTNTATPVTEGVTYTFLVLSQAGTNTASVRATIGWRTSAAGVLTSSLGSYTTNSSSALTLHTVTAVAPATAAYAFVYDSVSFANIGDVHHFSQHMLAVGTLAPASVADYLANYYVNGAKSTAMAVNQAFNPSFETNATGWTASANVTQAQTAAWAAVGGGALSLIKNTATGACQTSTNGPVVRCGPVVRLRTYTLVCVTRAIVNARNANVRLRFNDSAGTFISEFTGTSTATSTVASTLLSVTGVAPATAVIANAWLQSAGADCLVGDGLYFDAVGIFAGTVAPSSVADYLANYYVDGSTAGGSWAAATDTFSFEPAWHPGGATAHTIEIESSIDSGATWGDVRNGSAAQAFTSTELVTLADAEAHRDRTMLYRARSAATVSAGAVASVWSPTLSVATVNDGTWWLKAVSTPVLNHGSVIVFNELTETVEADTGVFRPLDASYPVVISGVVWGEDGAYRMLCLTESDWQAWFKNLVRHTGIILVQDPTDRQKYVQWTKRDVKQVSGASQSRREIVVSFVEVASGL